MSSPTMYHLAFPQQEYRREDMAYNIDPGMYNMERFMFEAQAPMYYRESLSMPQFQMDAVSSLPLVNPRHGSPDSSHQSSVVTPPGEADMNFPPSPPAATSPFLGHQDPAMFQHFKFSDASFTPDPGYLDVNIVPPMDDYFDPAGGYNPMNRGFSLDSYTSSFDENSMPSRPPAPSEILASQRNMLTRTTDLPATPISTSTPAPTTSIYPPPDETSDVDIEFALTPRDDPKDDEYTPVKKHARRNKRKIDNATSPKVHKRTRASGMTPPTSPPETREADFLRPSSRKRPYHTTVGHPLPLESSGQGMLQCPDCPGKVYKDSADLAKHQRQQHTRLFVCVFGFAGCTSTFASKNEWKRHVLSQHLLLNYWLCQEGACANVENVHCEAIPTGAIFNRKDLYTQHVRRMHTSRDTVTPRKKVAGASHRKNSGVFSSSKDIGGSPILDEKLRQLQAFAHKERCKLPTHMECPVASCSDSFNGSGAWDERMEHVAKHLERSAALRANGVEEPDADEVVFGGPNDQTLLNWATRDDVAVIKQTRSGAYKLWNPLKGEPGSVGAGTGRKNSAGQCQQVTTAIPRIDSGDEGAEGDEDVEGNEDAEGDEE